jgi:hypothetical protein
MKNIHQKVQEDFLLKKGKKVPVGTVTGNYKKVSEGKWVKVKKGDSKKKGEPTKISPMDSTLHNYQQKVRQLNYAIEVEKPFADIEGGSYAKETDQLIESYKKEIEEVKSRLRDKEGAPIFNKILTKYGLDVESFIAENPYLTKNSNKNSAASFSKVLEKYGIDPKSYTEEISFLAKNSKK